MVNGLDIQGNLINLPDYSPNFSTPAIGEAKSSPSLTFWINRNGWANGLLQSRTGRPYGSIDDYHNKPIWKILPGRQSSLFMNYLELAFREDKPQEFGLELEIDGRLYYEHCYLKKINEYTVTNEIFQMVQLR